MKKILLKVLMMNNLLICQGLSISRNQKLLIDNANFAISKGEVVWLAGASGKTSLIEAIAGKLYCTGLLKLNWAESQFLAKVSYVEQFSQFKDKQGMCDFYYQQRFNSYDAEMTITVKEELANLLADDGIKINLELLIELFNFTNKLNSSLLHLSSGERKKLQLIKVLANPTQLIILDNPLTGLDKSSMAKLADYISNLSRLGITFIIIDRLNYVFNECKNILFINTDKQIIKCTKIAYLANYPQAVGHDESAPIDFTLAELKTEYNNIVKFTNVTIKYASKQILSQINWQIRQGEKWLLEGENGAGKSTILSLITGDNPQAYANDICLFDIKRGSGETIWDNKSKIGYISPELQWNFAKNLTCLEVVLTGYFDTPGLYNNAKPFQINYAQQVLAQVNLTEYAQQNYIAVANGIQRSILLVRALIKNPPLLIFDEPCQGMSESQSRFFVQLIDKLFMKSNHTIIYVTHRLDEMPKCLMKRLTITNGQIIKNEDI